MKSEFYGTEIFLDNEFTQEYLGICRAAIKRKSQGYYEEHMVIPMELWPFLPLAKKGQLKKAMPDEKKAYCKLTPEEHFRCHELLELMVEPLTKQHSIMRTCLGRLRKDTTQGYKDAKEYANAQLAANAGKDWSNLPEMMKYHPEIFENDGTLRRI